MKYKFTKKYDYGGKMDPEVVDLCNAMNALPGIRTFESCCGHGKYPFQIWFEVRDPAGLFFLVRCVDRRYWEHGWRWQISLSVGDLMREDGYRPTHYLLESVVWWDGAVRGEDGKITEGHGGKLTVGQEAYDQAQDLIENMNEHLNIERFMSKSNLNVEDFDVGRD